MQKKNSWLREKLLDLGLEVTRSFDRGTSILGYNVAQAKHPVADRSAVALQKCLQLKPNSVLDVGSGGGEHAREFSKSGAQVICVDFGTSVYAQKAIPDTTINVVYTDFTTWEPTQQFDLVWASHVLEHQRNAGFFIERLIACCSPDGHVAITVPNPHRNLWGGHLSLWTPGFLAYNCVMCGVDLSDAQMVYGYREFSIIFKPKKVILPDLSYDSGDIHRIKHLFPMGFGEDTDAWF
ncbi:methyltransferase family protein [Dyadobacter jejuensis]|uniref:Methyltransferase family protein n=1 Tax=Dyadobacter jejuensis TaxID=1082580 RepID=A0A316ASG9_9BACT|nr:class I SAM-dependent methyltransferase [Dyadobacter jejuensis]PWJ60381.1 methyltransferase family protein [Dyadobacter jejuensis]